MDSSVLFLHLHVTAWGIFLNTYFKESNTALVVSRALSGVSVILSTPYTLPVSPVPAELTLCTATWLQAPGAAPQSTTLCPGCKSRNLSSISISLKALRHRKFCWWAALTYGSLSCRSTQRCPAGVLLLNFFIRQHEEWSPLLWRRDHHIVLTEREVMCSVQPTAPAWNDNPRLVKDKLCA